MSDAGIPIRYFVERLEPGAQQQAEFCARLPHAFHHIAVMPDAHQGYAMPVGGVMAMRGAVMPNAVGVDIGCGMIAARTPISCRSVRNDLETLAQEILHRIPTGFRHHKRPQDGEIIDRIRVKGNQKRELEERMPIVAEHRDEIPNQLGTLGGGNHFIELQRDEEDRLWIMLHSGSRNIGLKIANAYHRIAKDYGGQKEQGLSKDYAFLPLDLPEAHQ